MELLLRASFAVFGLLSPVVAPAVEPPSATDATTEPTQQASTDDSAPAPDPASAPDPTTQATAPLETAPAETVPPETAPVETAPPPSAPSEPAETTPTSSVSADPCVAAPSVPPESTSTSVAAEPEDGTQPTTETAPPTTVAPTTTVCDPANPAEGEPGQDEPAPTTTATTPTTTAPPTAPEGDPLTGEAPPEDVPQTDETVPAPGGAYADQIGFQPAEVLWSSVRAAETKVTAARVVQEERIAAVRQVRLAHKELRVSQRALGQRARSAAEEIEEAQTSLTERAVAAFVNDDALNNAIVGSLDALDHDEILEFRVRRRLLDTVLDQDENAIQAYLATRSEIDEDVLDGLDELRAVERALRQSTDAATEASEAVAEAEKEFEAFSAGSAIYIDDVRFPVGDGYGVPLIDSYGFPRMPGTPDEHWHEGIDIFAPSGTPLVATERGVVTRVGSGRLGGLTVWLRGESGTDWYYAHLLEHAPGLVEGMVVDAGELLGYVGNTGNARSTPAHLHLQVHPNGGDPVNPYPLLKVISDRDLSRAD